MSGKTGRNQIPIPSGTTQGIVTILTTDNKSSAGASIRRTLSADMSSKKWLQQSGFHLSPSPRKNNVPSSSLASSSSDSSSSSEEFDQMPGQDDVWRSIQAKNNSTRETTKSEPWGSILPQKSDGCLLPPPYVHPLAKRSFGSMSEWSLEICTESLGSETGSDCSFATNRSIHCPNDVNFDNGKQEGVVQKEYCYDHDPHANLHVVKYKNPPTRLLPPPLPSTSGIPHRCLRPRREDGRLVLEAVPISPGNNFRACREGGRLVLTLLGGEGRTAATEHEEGVLPPSFEAEEAVDGEDEELAVENMVSLSGRMLGLPEKRVTVKKFMAVGSTRVEWGHKGEEEVVVVQQSLPTAQLVGRLIPQMVGADSLNLYEYFWKNRMTGSTGFVSSVPGTGLTSPMISVSERVKSEILSYGKNEDNKREMGNQNWVIMKGNKGEDLVPYLRGCKEPRRSLCNWEPYCIAIS